MHTLSRAQQQQRLGIGGSIAPQRRRHQVDLLLRAHGLLSTDGQGDHAEMEEIAGNLLRSFREQQRRLRAHRCAADARIEAFLGEHFADFGNRLTLPDHTIVLAEHGVARELSLPGQGDSHAGSLLTSYRVRNGVLHNPKSDRRTTEGTFHVVEGGLPVPGDKKAVPKTVFAEMFR
ncbi:MAG: hypothetical protein M3478_08945, partial [Planctomycetota bacterium]|nr:hypothetical protein [Planctomycetota bacterium]